ncbi:sel1 repeat family protein [Parashewanella spongiae]|uniref:Sel1 repeat family protein n=1 Tax=Parashewanella spongiae TaxID=342950 RepID=A0A3A6U4G2_9GAMM|nr:sel1 repeat family protein [Parashewanella spongiae]MCL1079028.1 sel1 repeat family protein [Parashewanella spongiae]RJY10961.1 sel1 repeat family protein [Parashewanella spongiae]
MTIKLLSTCTLIVFISGCSTIQHDERTADNLLAQGKHDAAYKHYRYLAEFGLPKVQNKLAKIYLEKGDEPQALAWLAKSAKSGDISAQLKRARVLAYSENETIRDINQATSIILNLIEQNYEPASNELIKLYLRLDNIAVPKQYIQEIKLKADQGNAIACELLAELFIKNKYTEIDQQQAKNYAYCALKEKSNAFFSLATLYNTYPEIGSFEQFFTSLKKYSDEKSTKAAIKIARHISNGQFIHWNHGHSEQLLLWAAQSELSAYYQLAKLYIVKPTIGKTLDEITHILQQGKQAGSIECYGLEAEMSLFGIMTIQDPWHAEQLLLNISEPSPYVDFLLGTLYSRGFMGEPDYPKGIAYLNQSAKGGYKRADKELAKIYSKGFGFKLDFKKAIKHQILSNADEQTLVDWQQRFGISDKVMSQAQSLAQVERLQRMAVAVGTEKDNQL